MQIVAFDTDDKADGSGKAPITWIAEHILETSHRMNPALETNYVYPSGKSFVRNSSSASNTGYNQWKSQNAYKANNTAKITFTVTAVATKICHRHCCQLRDNAEDRWDGCDHQLQYECAEL